MAISQIELQYRYSGKGPVDAKSLVKTYSALLSQETWLNDAGKLSAYNGMVVTVWLDDDHAKNGVYRLHDASVTSILKTPDVTQESNWHKLAELSEIVDLRSLITKAATKEEVEAALASKLDSLALEGYYTKTETYSKEDVDALIADTASEAAESTDSALRQLEAHVAAGNSKFDEVFSLLNDYDAEVLPAVAANTIAISALIGDASVEGSVKKTVADAIAGLPRATATTAGLVKAGEDISVDTDGTLKLDYVSTDKLVQGVSILVLHGGDADDTN